jgi:YHS domain-containing protein
MPTMNQSGQPGADDEAVQEALAPHGASGIPVDQQARDPVCGATVDMRTAQYTTTFPVDGGALRTFYFDSDECKQTFERDPDKYTSKA